MPLSCTIVVLFFSTLVSPIGSVDQKQMICMGKPVSQGKYKISAYNFALDSISKFCIYSGVVLLMGLFS